MRGLTHCVVIPTVGRAPLLERTLDALAHQTVPVHEVIVVCDGPDPATEALSARHRAPFRLSWMFEDKNRGQAAARNIGAHATQADLVMFLDDETLPESDWLSQHLRHHHRGESVVVMGRLRNVYEEPAGRFVEDCMRRRTELIVTRLHELLRAHVADACSEYWVGLNTSMLRRDFVRIGGFDMRLRYVQEDAELAARASLAGVRFEYEPQALVMHVSSKDLASKHREDAERFGWSDVYRARDLGEKLEGAHAATLPRRRWRGRMLETLAWHHPRFVMLLARTLGALAEATRSEFLFWRWAGLTFSAAYWRGVRSWGIDRKAVEHLFVRKGDA